MALATAVARSPVTQVAVFGDQIASSSSDHTIRVWTLQAQDTRPHPLILRGHYAPVTTLAVPDAPDSGSRASAASPLLLSGGHDGAVRAWATADGNARTALQHGDWVRCVSAQAGRVGVGVRDGSLTMWDLASATRLWEASAAHDGVVWALAHVRSTAAVVSGGMDGRVRVWDSRSGASVGSFCASMFCPF
jgi:WD40 repeat protein